MAELVPVAKVEELPPGARKLIEVDGVTVALINVDGEIFCIEDICSHDGGPVAEGHIDGFVIECPRHGAQFDLRDGCALTMPATVSIPTYLVKVDDDQVYVESPEDW